MGQQIRIGVIADTHGLFDEAIQRHFTGVDHIVHAGDIGDLSVLTRLRAIALVTAVSGNVDGYERSGIPPETVIELGGKRLAVIHQLFEAGKMTTDGRAFLHRTRPAVCIYGHTHRPKADWLEGTLVFNPGSAGPKRFRLPRVLGLLTIDVDGIAFVHLHLPERPESPAPSRVPKQALRGSREMHSL